jgi:hypothetical protein
VRRRIEGLLYESVEAEEQLAGGYLKELEGDEPKGVERSCGWGWLRESIEALCRHTPSQ